MPEDDPSSSLRTVRLVRDHQVEIRGREERPVLVVEKQRLDRADHDLGRAPVVAFFLVDNRLEVGGKQARENLARLLLKLKTVDQKEHAAGVSSPQEQLDYGRGCQRLAGPGGHLEQESIMYQLSESAAALDAMG